MLFRSHLDCFKREFVELLFEKYDSSGVYFKNSASLASFVHSKENGIVIDVGGFNTNVSAVHEGDLLVKRSLSRLNPPHVRRRDPDQRNGSPPEQEQARTA